MLLAATGSVTANEMLHRFYTDDWPRSRVATLARLVDAAAVESDAVALGILSGAAQQLAMLAGAVRGELWSPGSAVEIAYIGGVFQSGILLEKFRTLVELQDGVRCGPPRRGPAEGALAGGIPERGAGFLKVDIIFVIGNDGRSISVALFRAEVP